MIPNQNRRPAIAVQGLQKSYNKLHVLRGVDFDVAPRSGSCTTRMPDSTSPSMKRDES
jgi:ABC-type sugar transport system ATPase subunit